LLRQTNVLIQPSKREGLSRSILEALACGRPVISSNAPGCAALIEEGENGWLFSTDNEKELTQVIQKVLQIPYDTLFSMSQRTKDSISSTYLNRAIHGYYSKIVMSQIL
jgi:glycosyltransferase involved in cell wall biosynthesis